MRRLSARRSRRDRGAVALIVTLLFSSGVLLGLGALTVDVGQIYAERRQLQNGADAAALSLAQTCAAAPADCSWSGASGGPTGLVTLNNLNAGTDQLSGFDTTTYPQGICGNNVGSGLPTCQPPSGSSADCPKLPSYVTGTTKYVEVRTRTQTTGGTILPSVFGRAVTGTPGSSVTACSRAALVGATTGTVFPMTFSLCEWNNLAGGGDPNLIVPPPPYPPYPSDPGTYGSLPGYEKAIYLHDTTGATGCSKGASGANLPGGFGWLNPDGNCEVKVEQEGEWLTSDPGNSAPCSLTPYRGTVVFLPIFDDVAGQGRNGRYHVKYLVAFYLTGWSVPGDRQASTATGNRYCRPSQTCIYGWFTSGLIPAGSATGGGSGGSPTAYAVQVAG